VHTLIEHQAQASDSTCNSLSFFCKCAKGKRWSNLICLRYTSSGSTFTSSVATGFLRGGFGTRNCATMADYNVSTKWLRKNKWGQLIWTLRWNTTDAATWNVCPSHTSTDMSQVNQATFITWHVKHQQNSQTVQNVSPSLKFEQLW